MTISPPGLSIFFIDREIFRLILDMVPYIADKKPIDRLIGQQRIVGIGEDRDDVGRFGLANAPVDVTDHVGAHVHGINFSLGADKVRQTESEIARTGADVGDDFAWLDDSAPPKPHGVFDNRRAWDLPALHVGLWDRCAARAFAADRV